MHYLSAVPIRCPKPLWISLVPLTLITVYVILIRYVDSFPCERTLQFSIEHFHYNSPLISASCTLNHGQKNEQASRANGCSSFVDDGTMVGEHFGMFHRGCWYCCIGDSSNGTDERSSSRVDPPKTSGTKKIDKPMISSTNHSSSKQLTLNEIGIKKVFVINLNSRPDRLANVVALLGYLQFPFTRFPAIDVKSIYKQLDSLHPRTNFFRQIFNRSHNDGQIGAWQSHLQVYFRIVEESKTDDRPVLILEDDIDMELETPVLLRQALQSLPNDWEMFLVGHSHVQCTKTYATLCRVGHFYCTHAYIIRNATVASRIADGSNTVHTQAADILLMDLVNRGSLIVYASYPRHIVVQDRKSFGSNIVGGAIPEVGLQRSLKNLLRS